MFRITLTILVGVAIAAPFIVGQSIWFVEEHMTTDERLKAAYERGWRDALSTTEPVNNDLEQTCLKLWFDEQNAEAARRQLR